MRTIAPPREAHRATGESRIKRYLQRMMAHPGTSPKPQVAGPQEWRPRMKIETIVWMVLMLIGAALAGWLGALLLGVLWLGYALGIARAAIHVVWMVFVLIGA